MTLDAFKHICSLLINNEKNIRSLENIVAFEERRRLTLTARVFA